MTRTMKSDNTASSAELYEKVEIATTIVGSCSTAASQPLQHAQPILVGAWALESLSIPYNVELEEQRRQNRLANAEGPRASTLPLEEF